MEQAPAPTPEKKKKKSFSWFTLIAWILLLSFITIQFFQPDKNNYNTDFSNDITAAVPVPDSVHVLLQAACYDCHSNNTQYPWYTNIQPVGWWLRGHIDNGKSNLNFNEFAAYSPDKQKDKLGAIAASQQDEWMPLKSYTWMHKEAKLTPAQRQQIIAWTEAARTKLKVE